MSPNPTPAVPSHPSSQFATFVHASLAPTVVTDRQGKIIDWNAAAERLYGWPAAEIVGRHLSCLVPAAERAAFDATLRRLGHGEALAARDGVRIDRNGIRLRVCVQAAPLRDDAGHVVAIVESACALDRCSGETWAARTARQRAEEALRASEERFRQIADSINEVFWLTSPDGREVFYVSPAYDKLWGRPRDRLLDASASWLDAIHVEDRDRVRLSFAARASTGVYDEEYRVVLPDGGIRWIRDRAFPVHDDQGRLVRLAGVAEDITEERQLRSQLQQAQKMEAIGQLAGGVAHDFNNLLTVITGYDEMLLQSMPDDDPARELVVEIGKAAHRAGGLTRQLLAFSRKQVLAPTIVDVNDVVRDTERMLRRVIGEDIALETALDPALGPVRIDRGELERTLLNLAVNARDAMPLGGRLTIETATVDLPADPAAHDGAARRRHVCLTIGDSGTGMSDAVKRRLFEPFFTTKAPGKGTGLGLAVVHGFVKQSGGEVEVQTEPGAGTRFRIYLPCVDASERLADVAMARALPSGHGTILLVEDDEAVAELTRRILERCGYTVFQANRPDQALRIAARQHGDIDLLITDVVLPDMGGRVLAERLRQRHPHLEVLYMSGYTDDAVLRNGVRHDQHGFIQKPFTPAAITGKVREVLAGRRCA